MTSKILIAISLVLLALLGLAVAFYPYNVNIASSGGIVTTKTFRLYTDKECQYPVVFIDHSGLQPGGNHTVNLYLMSLANISVILDLTVNGWDPPNARDYIDIIWNLDGYVLAPHTPVLVSFTAYMSALCSITKWKCTCTIWGFSLE